MCVKVKSGERKKERDKDRDRDRDRHGDREWTLFVIVNNEGYLLNCILFF
jgi:hypothetical protein